MKRIVTILLFVVVSLCAKGQTASVPEYVWETDWMKSYLRFIRSYHNPHDTDLKDYEYFWFDSVDDDSIPEIVFFHESYDFSTMLTTYNGKVDMFGSWYYNDVQWKSGTGWIFFERDFRGHEWHCYYHLQDGIFTNVLSYESMDSPDIRSWTTFYGDIVCRTVGNIGGDCPYYLYRKKAYDKLEKPAFVDDMPLSGLGYIKIDIFLDKAKKVKNSRIDNN